MVSINKNKYKACLEYIDSGWDKITYTNKKDDKTLIGVPNKYVAPNSDWFAGDMFYWDSFFIILGLVDSGKVDLAKGIVDNFVYLYNRFGIIPSRNRFFNLGISQPPLLTSMALEVFSKTKDTKWLAEVARVAEDELTVYWADKHHRTIENLSRYCDHYMLDQTAEHESGWDMTSRFHKKCLDYVPVDLNSFLYKYESDLAKISKILNNPDRAKHWEKQAALRKDLIYKFCWNEKIGFFFDYNVTNDKRSSVYSLAGFVPVWAGLADKDDVGKMVKKLERFEYKGGLVTTAKTIAPRKKFQWDYPCGWAPLHYLIVNGLMSYGYTDDASRVGTKWVDLIAKVFDRTGHIWERYDVVHASVAKSERYPVQVGFGWTDGVFVRLLKDLTI